ncbi:MAG TPA: ATP synthase subunit I [Bacteroidia bacterium]|nr:ATP synthase subunit I [Bacteroidia bacterium]
MTVLFSLTIVFVAGIILGVIFFGGLWLTVTKGMRTALPGLVFLLSFFLRTGIVLPGFYFLAAGDWKKMLAGIAGFILARFLVMSVTRNAKLKTAQQNEGGVA